MPTAYEFDDRVVVIRLEGEYSSSDVEDTLVVATADPACPRDAVLLLDMSRSRAVARRAAEEIKATSRFVAARGARFGRRLGMVARGDAALARLRLAKSVMREAGLDAEAFADVEPARRWLLSDVSGAGEASARPGPATTERTEAFDLAQRRAASARHGSARCIAVRNPSASWLVISEQRRGEDRWALVIDAPGGERRLTEYPAQWMLLAEADLLELVGARHAADVGTTTPAAQSASVFAMRLDGFEAAVSYDEATGEFRGEVLNARAPLTFAGRSVEELRQGFGAALDGVRRGPGATSRN